MNEEINTLSFKYDEIESHFMHFIKEDGQYLFKNESQTRIGLQSHFN